MTRALAGTTVLLALVVTGSEGGQVTEAQAPSRPRTWRAGGLVGQGAGAPDPRGGLCAALAALDGLDLYVAVSRGEVKAGDVLVHLACGTKAPAASRAALVALATSADPRDVQVLFEWAASGEPARAADAVEALLLAGLPVDTDTVLVAYRSSDLATRRRLLVAMSAAAAKGALAAVAEVETGEELAREARRRLDALR